MLVKSKKLKFLIFFSFVKSLTIKIPFLGIKIMKTEEDLFKQIDEASKKTSSRAMQKKRNETSIFKENGSMKKSPSEDFGDSLNLSHIAFNTNEEHTAGNITDKIEINGILNQFSKNDVKIIKELIKNLRYNHNPKIHKIIFLKFF